jgi:hypothetical protein
MRSGKLGGSRAPLGSPSPYIPTCLGFRLALSVPDLYSGPCSYSPFLILTGLPATLEFVIRSALTPMHHLMIMGKRRDEPAGRRR